MRNNTEPKRPTHIIYQVNGEGDKARWTRIGAAWMHKDSKGANLVFDCVPLTGRTVIREATEKAPEAEGNGDQE